MKYEARLMVGRFTNLIFIISLSFSSIAVAQIDTWTRKTDMPRPRNWLSTATVNGKIYAIGGHTGERVIVSTVEEYDPATDTWTRKTDMPTPREGAATIAVNGKIYVIGGLIETTHEFLRTVEEYNPATDTWARKSDMQTPRVGATAGLVNGKIYVIGGNSLVDGTFTLFSTVEEYDPITDTWTPKADMPTSRGFLANRAPTVNGKIYVIGGWMNAGRREADFANVEVYDPATDTWAKKADIPTGRGALAVSEVNGKIYVIGGTQDRSLFLRTVQEYDPANDIWMRKADMLTSRWSHAASVVNGYIYAIGGWDGVSLLPTVEEYDTGVGIRARTISPQAGRVEGGDPLAILGSGFPPGVSVTIGGKPLTELKVTDTQITGVTPPGIAGEQEILITAPDLVSAISAGEFIYAASVAIVVVAITPANGSQAGGETGSLTGVGFTPDATVTIGDIPATNVVVTPTRITFTIPPGTVGEQDVVVTDTDGQQVTLRHGYTYNRFPTVQAIAPNVGGLGGDTQIAITGSNFRPGVVVVIGDKRVAQLNFFSSSELRLRTPPGSAGLKAVRVVNPDGQVALRERGFTYNPPPVIFEVTPDRAPLAAGTQITIRGRGFLPGAVVNIGGRRTLGAIVRSATEITATTPLLTPGSNNVVVRNPDGQSAMLENSFNNPALAVEPQQKQLTRLGELKRTSLLQNYPNPFNPETWLPYYLHKEAAVRVWIYNIKGELVRSLEIGKQPEGAYLTREQAIYWDGRDQRGQPVASGVYFYRFLADDFSRMRRMVLLK